MKQKIGNVGYVGPEKDIKDIKQLKDEKPWPKYQDQHHKNLPVANWPRKEQLELEKEKGIAIKLKEKLHQKKYRSKHKPQRKRINKEYYKTHKKQFKNYNLVYRQKLTSKQQEKKKEINKKYQKEYRKKHRDRLNKQELECYRRNKGIAKEPIQINFIEIVEHKFPKSLTTIRIENLKRLQEAIVTLNIIPLVILYGQGKWINILISGLKPGHQVFFFHKDNIVYYAVEYTIKVKEGKLI